MNILVELYNSIASIPLWISLPMFIFGLYVIVNLEVNISEKQKSTGGGGNRQPPPDPPFWIYILRLVLVLSLITMSISLLREFGILPQTLSSPQATEVLSLVNPL